MAWFKFAIILPFFKQKKTSQETFFYIKIELGHINVTTLRLCYSVFPKSSIFYP